MTILKETFKFQFSSSIVSDSRRNIDILLPRKQKVPLVFASPHSGSNYPSNFLRVSALDQITLRKSEDMYVDQIFSVVLASGAPLIRALLPRSFIDLNREPYELDPDMFIDELPSYVNRHSPRVVSGFGTIARIVSTGNNIYTCKLLFSEVQQRIKTFYYPYHTELMNLIKSTKERFGYCVLIDCHSMPSTIKAIKTAGEIEDRVEQETLADVVLGDRFGMSCNNAFTRAVEHTLRTYGYTVARNRPYSGGYTVFKYGQPARRFHALQIEINRRLYVNEETYQPSLGGIITLREAIYDVTQALTSVIL